ncbi:putative membrane protein [Halogeometricum rufum]|uniref:Putative membrane protein n=1 Tax=Halogeometricum rufum TaxID=553469 RepID=A0A1I6GEZ4_9EURY|nr:SHOCT domain-containing protein [Halogeometricum rufum]SFR40728.1 putative membrane protein [Halogeometricum rufum]
MSTNTTDRRLVALALVALGALVLLPALFMGFGMMGYGSMMRGGMWGGTWGGGGPAWMPLVGVGVQLLFLAVLAGVGYLVYRAVAGSSNGGDAALEELRLAYARGDLTEEEYENRREALERDS